MAPDILHLPDGQSYTVTTIFGGIGFHSNDASHAHHFPVGWTISLHTEEERSTYEGEKGTASHGESTASQTVQRRTKAFSKPTLTNDTLSISSISQPSDSEYQPPASPTRQIAFMLWVSLLWYFHQPAPEPFLASEAAKDTPHEARPAGEWSIMIKRDGVFRSKNLIPKLERMGLIASRSSAVGTELDDGGNTWDRMFVSQSMFWQIPPNLFLFTLKPAKQLSASKTASRPSSPAVGEGSHAQMYSDLPGAPMPTSPHIAPAHPIGPFFSTSHLPTYYPPLPLQYTYTNNVRHPVRPKPARMGEVFYTRFVPSYGQYLSFRVASMSSKPVPYLGPVGPNPPEHRTPTTLSDTDLLKQWHANPRVNKFWGDWKEGFLEEMLAKQHTFPVIGLWDGVPFGYFELYWVKEDLLGWTIGGEANDWDRGLHVMVGEEWSRGRVPQWLSSLEHWCYLADSRTMSICLEPRVDNERFLRLLAENGFHRERTVSFVHKRSWLVRTRRETFKGPAL